MSVTAFTLTLLVVYLIGLKGVSYFAYRRSSENTEDYFLAKRDVGLFALVATTMASIFSTGTVVSAPSEFFTEGASYFWVFFFSFISVAMMPVVIRFWKIGKAKSFVTPGEMLGDFYQSRNVQLLVATIGLLSLLPYAAAQLVAVGKTFEALTDGVISYSIGITIATLAIAMYLYYGGSRAVIWTDAIQGVIFSSLLIATGCIVVSWAGGWETVMTNLKTTSVERSTFTPSIEYFEYAPVCFTFFLLPYVWQRMYMARSAKMIAKNIAILPVVFSVLFFCTWVIGSSALVLFPQGLADGDSVLGALFTTRAPYFGAFVLVAAFSAGMSTVDSQLLSAGSLFTNDIASPSKQRKQKEAYSQARKTTLLLMVIIYIWSLTLQNRSVMSLIMLGISLTGVLAPAVYGMFFWRRASTLAAATSLAIGLTAFLLKEFTPLSASMPGPLGSASWGFASATVVFFFVSFLPGRNLLEKKRAEYKEILRSPVPEIQSGLLDAEQFGGVSLQPTRLAANE